MSPKLPAVSVLFLLFPGIPAHGTGPGDADVRLFSAQQAVAEKGDSRAQYYLGEMFEQGLGTRQDVDEAFKWYAKAAEQGDPLAKRKLAHRNEIIAEIRRERELASPKSAEGPVAPAQPELVPKDMKRSKTAANMTQAAPPPAAAAPHADQAQAAQDKIREAERDKRRAAVRAMIMERMRHPVGELFE